MTIGSERVKNWRHATKQRMIDAFGGKCCICGYNKCQDSLAFHHLDPEEKDFGLSQIMANPISWSRIVVEIRKCICVCGNCHGEIHNGMTEIPKDAIRFNEDFSEYKISKTIEMTNCPICEKLKPAHMITCSKECAARKSYKVNWDSINLEEEIKTKSIVQIANELGCSDVAVRKRLKKLQIIPR